MRFDNSYAQLPPRFYTKLEPTPVTQPASIRVNFELADLLGIDGAWLASAEGTDMIAGNHVPDGADPIATVYAGHQFGGWVPQLGDGRAILLGEVIGQDGVRYDIQLKGSGPTPYSRGGDGRAPLGPVLREYIVSEAMAARGIPSTRSLAAVTTGDYVFRDSALPGGVLARVAQSHIRVGTFQYFAARRDTEALRLLVEYVAARHFPNAVGSDNPCRAMLEAVIARQASLVAQWQLAGFIHGVMNTDNMLLSGESIDYGPCAFMDSFDPAAVYSSIDHAGRYAYGNQPGIAHWNLSCLAQALLPVLDEGQEKAVAIAQGALDAFPEMFRQAYLKGASAKLGLASVDEGDESLVSGLFELMAEHKTDFTLAFRRLSDLADPGNGAGVGELFEFNEAFEPWLQRWRQRLAHDGRAPRERQAGMYLANPVFIPRNHLVEEAISAADTQGDFTLFHALAELSGKPQAYKPGMASFARPPRPEQVVRKTFCGT